MSETMTADTTRTELETTYAVADLEPGDRVAVEYDPANGSTTQELVGEVETRRVFLAPDDEDGYMSARYDVRTDEGDLRRLVVDGTATSVMVDVESYRTAHDAETARGGLTSRTGHFARISSLSGAATMYTVDEQDADDEGDDEEQDEAEPQFDTHDVVDVLVAGEAYTGVVASTSQGLAADDVTEPVYTVELPRTTGAPYGAHDDDAVFVETCGTVYAVESHLELVGSPDVSHLNANNYSVDRHLEALDREAEEQDETADELRDDEQGLAVPPMSGAVTLHQFDRDGYDGADDVRFVHDDLRRGDLDLDRETFEDLFAPVESVVGTTDLGEAYEATQGFVVNHEQNARHGVPSASPGDVFEVRRFDHKSEFYRVARIGFERLDLDGTLGGDDEDEQDGDENGENDEQAEQDGQAVDGDAAAQGERETDETGDEADTRADGAGGRVWVPTSGRLYHTSLACATNQSHPVVETVAEARADPRLSPCGNCAAKELDGQGDAAPQDDEGRLLTDGGERHGTVEVSTGEVLTAEGPARVEQVDGVHNGDEVAEPDDDGILRDEAGRMYGSAGWHVAELLDE